MSLKKQGGEKTHMHPRNKNRKRYDLNALLVATPELADYMQANKSGEATIDFASPKAVRLLNTALLRHHYGITYWDFPEENLCPPIPGRAEYIHHVADLLSEYNEGSIPEGEGITCLDIGIGASCIYPIIGVSAYGWRFIGSDIDPQSIQYAAQIVESNRILNGKVTCKIQHQASHIFRGIVGPKDRIELSISNPPFHASAADLHQGNKRKVKNLTGKKGASPRFNFSGNSSELIYKGGEFQFIKNMIRESRTIPKSVFWFTTLVSKASNLNKIYKELAIGKPTEQRTIDIQTGNKMSRIVAWTYLSAAEQSAWRASRWTTRPSNNF
jgi:23S rRNA (adenine1618-N6)-methyltransferase